MPRALQIFDRNAPFEAIMGALDEDGGAIVTGFIDTDLLGRLNRELDAAIAGTLAGGKAPGALIGAFWGKQTKRFTRLAAISPSFPELLEHELMHRWAAHDLEGDYWLNTSQAMIVGPGQPAQYLHRDIALWPMFDRMGPAVPDCLVSAMIALGDFTEEVGATRVIPGSHKWEDFTRPGTQEETVGAVMPAGSALFYKGKVMHGAGANRTSDTWRRGLYLGYVLGWLTPEEANPIAVPWEIAKTLSPRAQRLLGYASRKLDQDPSSVVQWLIDFEDVAKYMAAQEETA